ncbi:MAG: DUF2203 domain-containing protein [Planctomycetaceae bacterium]
MNSAARKPKRFFTVEEANQRLPLVRAIVGDIMRLYEDVHERKERLSRVRQLPGSASRDDESVYGEEVRQIEDDLEKDITRLEEFVDELRELGVELKDPLSGLIDFPARIEGREVYLCWKHGEEDIAHWHEVDAGFSGRQSLFSNVSGEPPGGAGEDGA